MQRTVEIRKILLCFLAVFTIANLFPMAAKAAVSAYGVIQGESFDTEKSKGVSTSWENDQTVTLGWVHDGDYACYKGINFDQGASRFRLRFAKTISSIVEVKVYIDSPNGTLLTDFALSDTTGSEWTDYKTGSVKISKQVSGVHDVYIVFHSLETTEQLLHIDCFQFVASEVQDPAYLPPKGLVITDDMGVKYRVLEGGKTCELYKVPSSAEILDTRDTIVLTNTINGTPVRVELNVVKVAAKAAKNCTKLQIAYFGNNVTTVGKYAFKGCKKLKMLIFRSDKIKTKVKASAFYDIKKKATIYAPKASLKAMKKVFKADAKTKAKKFKYQVYTAVG